MRFGPELKLQVFASKAASDKLLLLLVPLAWVKIYENELQLLCAYSWDQLKFIRNLRVIYECLHVSVFGVCECTESKIL